MPNFNKFKINDVVIVYDRLYEICDIGPILGIVAGFSTKVILIEVEKEHALYFFPKEILKNLGQL